MLDSPGLRTLVLIGGLAWAALSFVFFALFGVLIALDQKPLLVLVSLLVLYPSTFVAVFLGVALVAGAHEAVEGRQPTLRASLAVARGRVREIAAWALLATGVGILLEHIVQRIPWAGRLAQWALGAAWAVVTLFAVPVIALEGRGARDALRRSASIFRARWGEGIVGSLSIWAVLLVATIPGCMLVGAGFAALDSGPLPVAIVLVATGATLVTLAGYAGFVMRDIYSLALYRYATDGVAVAGFDEDDLVGGIRLRRRGALGLPRRSPGRREDPRERRIYRRVLAGCWAAALTPVVVMVTGEVAYGDSDNAPAVFNIAAGVLFTGGGVGLAVAAGVGLYLLRERRPRPWALAIVLLGGIGCIVTLVWATIGHEGTAYTAPLVIGLLVSLITLSIASLVRLVRPPSSAPESSAA